MKSKWPLIVSITAIVLIGAIWIGSRWFGSSQEEIFAARIDYLSGQIQIRRHQENLEFTGPLNKPLPLYIGDRVELHPAAKLQVTFRQGHQVEISAGAVFVLARWNQLDPLSPILLQITGGGLKRVQLGEDRLFILRNNELHSLESLSERALPELKVTVQSSSQSQDDAQDLKSNNIAPMASGKEEVESVDADTLSNNAIQRKLESQVTLLLQCQKLIPEKPSGRVVVAFLIDNNGKAKNIAATENTFKNKAVEQCVLSVIERIAFAPFEGTPIQVTFPIAFE